MIGGAPGIPRAAQAVPLRIQPFMRTQSCWPIVFRRANLIRLLPTPKISASDPAFSSAALTDGDYGTSSELAFEEGKNTAWIQWEFPASFCRTILHHSDAAAYQPAKYRSCPTGDLSYSADGQTWTKLISLPDSPQYARTFGVRTFSLPAVSARYFRLTVERAQLTADQILRGLTPAKAYPIADIALGSSPRITFFEDKASFGTFVSTANTATPEVAPNEAVLPTKS